MSKLWDLTEAQRRQIREAHASAKERQAVKRDERQRAAVANDPYANAVIDILSGDFPDLHDPIVADVIRKQVYANAHIGCGIQVIVDDPFTANWRLIPAQHDRRRVHLACWRRNHTEADSERRARLNQALDALSTGSESES